MTDPIEDRVRALVRLVADAPEPHPWSEVERRALESHDDQPARRPRVWLATAAATVAVTVGAVVLLGADREPDSRIDPAAPTPPQPVDSEQPTLPTAVTLPEPTTPSSEMENAPTTSATPTTVAGVDPEWSGGLVDDLEPDDLRPLTTFSAGDVLVPTAPTGWRLTSWGRVPDGAQVESDPVESYVNLDEARSDGRLGQIVNLTVSREPRCTSTLGCTPTGATRTIDGVTWEEIGPEQPLPNDSFDPTFLRASIGDRWIDLATGTPQLLDGALIDDPQIVALLEGLRLGTIDDLEPLGPGCWGCNPGAVDEEGNPFPTRIGDLDFGDLRPLDTLGFDDAIVPTAPADWRIRPHEARIGRARAPIGRFDIHVPGPAPMGVWVGRACDEGVSPCTVLADRPPVELPIREQLVVDGVSWGYGGVGLAAIVGDFIVVITGTWDGSTIPLLDDPLIVEFIEGLRVVDASVLDDLGS